MKTLLSLFLILALTPGLLTLDAAERKQEAGPKGGRLLEKTIPQAEFLVEKDRTVAITFYNDKLQAVPVGNQVVTVIAEAKNGKARLELARKDGRLVSQTSLPDGDGYMVVVMIKSGAQQKPQNFRFRLELHECGGCRRAEYACTCGH